MAEVGRLALGLGGALLGFALGGPLGASIGFAAGSVAGLLLFPPPPVEGPRLEDLKVMSSAPGQPRPLLYGTMRLGGNVIWATDLEERSHDEGGKGGPTVTSFEYFGNFAVALCEGPIQGVVKVFADGKLLVDFSETNTGATTSDAFQQFVTKGDSGFRVYLGTATQQPDPLIQTDLGIDDTPAFRGTAYVVFDSLALKDFGNRIPQITCVVTTALEPAYPTASIEPAIGANAFLMLGQAGGFLVIPQITATTALLVRAHAQSQQIVGEFTPDLGTTLGSFGPEIFSTDALGRIYGCRVVFGNANTKLYQFDGETMAILATSPNLDWRKLKTLVVGDPAGIQHVLCYGPTEGSGSGRWSLVNTVVGAGGELPIIGEFDLGNIYAYSPTGTWTVMAAAADANGDGWMCAGHDGTGELYLFQLHSVSGQIKAGPYLLSGVAWSGAAADICMGFDWVNNSLLIYQVERKELYRWSLDSLSITASNIAIDTNNTDGDEFESALRGGAPNGKLYMPRNDVTFQEIDTATLVATVHNQSSWGQSADFQGGLYDPTTHAFIREKVTTGEFYWFFLDRVAGGGVTLASIVNDISERVGITSGLRDTSELTDIVHGYAVTARMEARSAIQPLVSAYFFDGVESDFVVTFPKRGAAAVAALTEDDIGAAVDPNSDRPYLSESRREEIEMLARVDVKASLADIDYQIHAEYAMRSPEAIATERQIEIALPIAFDGPDEIAQIAEKHLFLGWASRTIYGLSVPLKHIRLDPADTITVTADSATHTIRLTETTLGANAVIDLAGESEGSGIYASTAVGHAPEGVPIQTLTPAAALTFHLLDTPLLRDDDDGTILYHAAGTYGTMTFPGALVEKTADGALYSVAAIINHTRAADIGVTTAALADAPGGRWTTWDRINSVNVRLFSGTLASTSELAVLNYANAVLIGDEIVQFATATLEADGSYTLSILLRGRRGTEWACGTHAANDRVIVLNANAVLAVETPIADLGLDRTYRATPIGGSLASAIRRDITWTAASLKPYAPCSVEGARGGSPQDWTISWLWRTRIGGEWLDFTDALFGEAAEGYEVDVSVSGSPSFYSITETPSAGGSWVDAANSRAIFTEADQRAAFGSPQSSLSVTVYQTSSDVGRGFGRAATLTG